MEENQDDIVLVDSAEIKGKNRFSHIRKRENVTFIFGNRIIRIIIYISVLQSLINSQEVALFAKKYPNRRAVFFCGHLLCLACAEILKNDATHEDPLKCPICRTETDCLPLFETSQ